MAFGVTMEERSKKKIMNAVGIYALVLSALMLKMVGDTDYSFVAIGIVFMIAVAGFYFGDGLSFICGSSGKKQNSKTK